MTPKNDLGILRRARKVKAKYISHFWPCEKGDAGAILPPLPSKIICKVTTRLSRSSLLCKIADVSRSNIDVSERGFAG